MPPSLKKPGLSTSTIYSNLKKVKVECDPVAFAAFRSSHPSLEPVLLAPSGSSPASTKKGKRPAAAAPASAPASAGKRGRQRLLTIGSAGCAPSFAAGPFGAGAAAAVTAEPASAASPFEREETKDDAEKAESNFVV